VDLGIKDKMALVTGASRGIGRAVAEALAREGCNLRLAARTREDLEAAAEAIRQAHNVHVSVHVCDLSRASDVEALSSAANDLDILVNNAGAIPSGDIFEVDSATWRRGWELKVFGFIDLTRAIFARMKSRKKGVIVNVIGNAAELPSPNYIAGSVGNAALNMFVNTLGGISMRDGVRVVGVHPGPTMSDRRKRSMMERARTEFGDAGRYLEFEKGLPAGRSATTEEIAWVVVFLASERAAHVSGTSIRVDAGHAVMPRS